MVRFVTVVKQREEIDTVSYHKLFDVLKQFQNEVNDIRSERLAEVKILLALLAPRWDIRPGNISSGIFLSLICLVVFYIYTIYRTTEQGVPLQAEQADWLEDTDEEIDEQELEAHYSYMAKIQEVSPEETSSTSQPLEQVQNHDENDVFANVRRHSEQPESINDTYVLEKDDSNVIPDSSNICTNDNQVDQNAAECVDERAALANLIANLTLDTEENKTILKQLKKANASLTQELKECKTNLDESSRALGEATSSRDSSLIALQTKQTELEKYTALNDLTSDYKILQTKLNETLGLLALKDIDIKEGLKTKTYEISVVNQKHDELVKKSLLTRSQFEGQLKEKTKVISDLKVKEGKDIDTMIEMDKQIKFLNEILYKRNQSIQTIHMLAPKCATYHGRSTFANPKYLKKAQSDKPRLYEIPYDTSDPANRFCPDGEETVTLENESRSKLDKDTVKPYNYTYQNSLYETFKPPSKAYLDQLERAKEVRKTMWRKTFVRTKPNIAKNVGFLPMSKSISKSRLLYNEMTNNFNHFRTICQQTWSNHTSSAFPNPTAKSMEVLIKILLMPLSDKTILDSHCFIHELKREMNDDLEYVNSLEKELDELESEKADFSKQYDLLLEECVLKMLHVHMFCILCNKRKVPLETQFDKPSVVRQPNAQRIPKPSVLVKTDSFSNSPEMRSYTWTQKPLRTKKIWMPKIRKADESTSISPTIDIVSRITNIEQLILFIVDSGCTKHMTGNLTFLVNFCGEFLGTVCFGNDQLLQYLCYGGSDSRKSTCFVRDLQGNDLLTGSRGSDLYTISLQETTSSTPICFMAKASPTQAWLWHRRLSHLNFDYITLLSKKEVVNGLPKLKYVKDQLCSSCEMSKAKRSSFKTKAVPSSKGRLNLLPHGLGCGPMRVASINGKKYILVIVDDYSRYTWTLFLRSKDETPEVLKDFLTMIQRNLQAQVITVRTDRGTEFLNKTLHAYFKEEGIEHQTSTPRTPEQNGVAKRRKSYLLSPFISSFDDIKEMMFSHTYPDLAPKRQEMSVENISSGLVPQGQKASDYDNSDPVPPRQNVVPPAEKTDSSQQGLEFLFSPS
ncbi:retrovirus-related pol polyprotein from transposon TNT 1-94 [Tanacetum coccineum]